MDIQQAEKTLRTTFGYQEFRPLQQEAIQQVLDGEDSLLIMPTGGGKSLCYQIPALLFEGLTIVVSPLISLMNDQVMQLRDLGIESIVINSSLDRTTYTEHIQLVRTNEVDLVYMAPETLLKPDMVELLQSVDVDLFAIDEAHCISEWGHDFRPEYRRLAELRKSIPDAACIALTATATEQVREDIRKQLDIDPQATLLSSFDRENLYLEVKKKQNGKQQLLDFLTDRQQDSGIIYCFSRKQVDELTADLREQGYDAEGYHAGKSSTERDRIQEGFVRDNIPIIVATIAFGMGINKPNVRYVVHYELPKNIESYYQQIGRAGRDGIDSDCLMLYTYSDVSKQRYFIDQKEEQDQERELKLLYSLVDYAETRACRRVELLKYFGEKYTPPCGNCDNCRRDEAEKVDVTVQAQKLLSCAVKTDQLYGITHLIQVLRGSKAQKVLKADHDQLSTYAIGKEWNKKQWRLLGNQLLGEEIIFKDRSYGSIKLNKEALKVLRGERKVFLPKDEVEQVKTTKKRSSRLSAREERDFNRLRKLRKKLADEQNVPPYIIFNDKSLQDLVRKQPTTLTELLEVHGVGEKKADKYGKLFLEELYAYAPSRINSPIARKLAKNAKRHVQSAVLFNEGYSLDRISEHMDIKLSTVVSHLRKYLLDGESLKEPERILQELNLTHVEVAEIEEVLQGAEDDRLKPVYEELNEQYSYEQLRAVQVIRMAKSQSERD
jgi:ATP-dependent DNA helicase RecQ